MMLVFDPSFQDQNLILEQVVKNKHFTCVFPVFFACKRQNVDHGGGGVTIYIYIYIYIYLLYFPNRNQGIFVRADLNLNPSS